LAEEQSGAIGHLLEDGTLSGEMLILRHGGDRAVDGGRPTRGA